MFHMCIINFCTVEVCGQLTHGRGIPMKCVIAKYTGFLLDSRAVNLQLIADELHKHR